MEGPCDECRCRSSERRLLPVASVAAAAAMFILLYPLCPDRVYVHDDLGGFHLPVRHFYAESLSRDYSFLWTPSLFCGYYIHGEGQGGFAHPLHLLLYALLPLRHAFNLEFFLSYPAALAGMWLFLRRRGLPPSAALLGGVSCALSASAVRHYVHLNMVAVAAHIPWLLLAADVALSGTSRHRRALAWAGIAALTASQGLLGHPQTMWLSVLAEVAYLLAADARPWRWGGWPLWASAKAVGLLAASAQWLPTLDILRTSERGQTTWEFLAAHSLAPWRLMELAGPFVLLDRNQEYGVYAGAGAMLLAILALLRWRSLGRLRPLARWAAGLGLLGLVLALGRYGLLYALVARLPGVGLFRCPSRHLFLFHLAVATLAAVGMAELTGMAERREALSRRQRLVLLAPLAAAVAVAAFAAVCLWRPAVWPSGGEWVRSARGVAVGAGLFGLATLLMALASSGRVPGLAVAALAVFAVLDPALYAWHTLGNRKPMRLKDFALGTAGPEWATGGRMDVGRETNAPLLSGRRLADGYVALPPAGGDAPESAGRAWPFDSSPEFFRAADVRWVSQSRRAPPWLARRPRDDAEGWRLPPGLPRAFLMDGPPDARSLGQAGPAADGDVNIVEDQPGRIGLRMRSARPLCLFLSERFHAGWQAAVDGRPVSILPAAVFMALPVGAGEHIVTFAFRPGSFRLGLALTAFGALLILVVPAAACLPNPTKDR